MEKKALAIIRYLIKAKYLIIKHRFLTILYINYQALEIIMRIEINTYNRITR